MAGYVGNIPVPQGTQTRQSFTATASQTSFPTIGYTAGFIDVYLNGIKLVSGTDFTASNGSDVVLTTGAAVNDVLDVVIFDTFDTSSGNFNNSTFTNSTLKSNVTLKNDTEQDTDGGRASKIIYQGEQSGGEISTLAEIEASHDGTADDEKGDLIFRTNDGNDGASPTERMRIDSGGNVGINATPKATHADADVVRFGGTGYLANWEDAEVYLSENMYQDTSGNYKYLTASHASLYSQTTGKHQFRVAGSGSADGAITFNTAFEIDNDKHCFFTLGTDAMGSFSDGISEVGTGNFCLQVSNTAQNALKPLGLRAENIRFATGSLERMRILDSGRVHIGQSLGSNAFADLSSSGNILVAGIGATFGDNAHVYNVGGFTGTYDLVVFRNGNGVGGSINLNGSTTTYNTSSDYRLKENVTNVTDGITRVKQLAPKRFNFIADADTTVDGFLAHEAATVVPEAVTGTKDELEVWKEHEELPDGVSVGDNKLDDNGNTIPKMQGVDQSKFVPLLTAALQEAIAKIETLEAKVAALEAE